MIVSGIGVQQILPRSGTGWQSANPTPDDNNDTDHGQTPAGKTDRAPAAPGTGRIVDRIA